jgi:hypothetical protein
MSVEEESETQPLVEDNPTSNSGSLDDSDAKPVTKGDPPEFSEVELQEAHKKYGRDIIFGDEVGDTGSLHRVRIIFVSREKFRLSFYFCVLCVRCA